MGNAKMTVATEFFRCVQEGWTLVGRKNGFLAYATRTAANGNKHTLFENGIRRMERPDGVVFRRELDGTVTRSASDGWWSCSWQKNAVGKHEWVGPSPNVKMLNYARRPDVEFIQGENGFMSRAVRTNEKGYQHIVYENGKELYKTPDGSTIRKIGDGVYERSNYGYSELIWGANPSTGHYGWQRQV